MAVTRIFFDELLCCRKPTTNEIVPFEEEELGVTEIALKLKKKSHKRRRGERIKATHFTMEEVG